MSLNTKAIQYRYQREAREGYKELLEPVLVSLYALLSRYSVDGVIPVERLSALLNEARSFVTPLFVSGSQAVSSSGIPVSPFARNLYNALQGSRSDVLQAHKDFYRDRLETGLVTWLETNTGGSFEEVHTWENEKGRDLNARIIALLVVFLDKLTRYLTQAALNGTSVLTVQREIAASVNVNRRGTLPTSIPDLAFDASRLLRNEVTRVYTDTVFTLAAINTLSVGIEWALSPRHPKRDICDNLATIDEGGRRLRPPYPVDTAPRVITDSHINCICSNYSSNEVNPEEVDRLNAERLNGSPAPVSPLSQGFN